MATQEISPNQPVPVDPEQFWHDERRKGIGGSDVHHLFPCLNLEDESDTGSRYGCPRRLGYEKLDVKPDFEHTPEQKRIFERGHILEDYAADRYMQATGRRVFRANKPIVSEFHPFQRVNIDRRIKADDRGRGTLECKSANEHIFFRMTQEGLPSAYALQLQHALAVTGDEWGSFAVIEAPDYLDAVIEQIEDERLRNRVIRDLAPKFQFFNFDVQRDNELIQIITEKEAQFWSLVEAKKLPDPLPSLDDERCKGCNYRRTCRGPQYAEANSKITRDKAGVKYVTIEKPEFAKLVADRLVLMKEIDQLEETMKALDLEIKQNFPPETGAVQLAGTPVKIRWSYRAGANRWDSEGLNADAGTIGRKLAFADWISEREPQRVAEFTTENTQIPSFADKYRVQGAPTRPFCFDTGEKKGRKS